MNKQEKQATKLICDFLEDTTNKVERTNNRKEYGTTYETRFEINGEAVCCRSYYGRLGMYSNYSLLIHDVEQCKKMQKRVWKSLGIRRYNKQQDAIELLIIIAD